MHSFRVEILKRGNSFSGKVLSFTVISAAMRGGVKVVAAVFSAIFMLFSDLHQCSCNSLNHLKGSVIMHRMEDVMMPDIPPVGTPQPFLPLLAPSPLMTFTNSSVPNLSGLCSLNFTASESLMTMTATDCWSPFASVLANVICCPQLEATISVLIGQSSKETNVLALNGTTAKHCLSDIEQVLTSQGANDTLQQICSIHTSNLTEGSCPVKDVDEFESTVDSSLLLASCGKVDPVKECCEQICQNAISEAAKKLSMKAYGLSSMHVSLVSGDSSRTGDCKTVVLRWLASKLDAKSAKDVLRRLSNCNLNKVCPLVLPEIRHVVNKCGNGINNGTACCRAMWSYVSHLQKQSLVTNLQALDCAASLGMKLQKANITENVYNLCDISLKDFSLQVGNQEKGCLLPSLPSDAVFDSSGVSFLCDLNDNIPAPWPSTSQLAVSSCNKTIKIPALPAAASAQNGLHNEISILSLSFASLVVLLILG